jgi:hypothetical protein
MTSRGPLNYTTSVEADKTAMECISILRKYGAKQIGLTFGDDQVPDGLSFTIVTRWGLRAFDLPVDTDNAYLVLKRYARDGKIRNSSATPAQAVRTGWRVLKDWLESQLAIIESGVMSAERVLSSYMLVDHGKTMLDVYAEQQAIEP